jgi:outer membrane biosynthesis protein TonB
MNGRREREIARRLAETRDVEPPADLLARIHAEIPAAVRVHQDATVREPGNRPPARQRWLIAASLAAMLGMGLFSLHVLETGKEEIPPTAEVAAARSAERPVLPEVLPAPSPPPAAPAKPQAVEPQPSAKKESTAPPPERNAPRPAEQQARREEELRAEVPDGVAGGVAGGIAGGVPGGVAGGVIAGGAARETTAAAPPAAAPPPSVPPAAPMAKSAKADRLDNLASYGRAVSAPEAEGAPAPVAGGERRWLLLFHEGAPTMPQTPPPIIVFDPAVVAHSRRIGGAAVPLYEVVLRPEAPGDATIATLRPATGAAPRRQRTLRVADLAPSWEQASAGFRLAALEAELDQVLAGARPRSDLPELLRRARELAGELSGDPRAAALLRRCEEAGAISP